VSAIMNDRSAYEAGQNTATIKNALVALIASASEQKETLHHLSIQNTAAPGASGCDQKKSQQFIDETRKDENQLSTAVEKAQAALLDSPNVSSTPQTKITPEVLPQTSSAPTPQTSPQIDVEDLKFKLDREANGLESSDEQAKDMVLQMESSLARQSEHGESTTSPDEIKRQLEAASKSEEVNRHIRAKSIFQHLVQLRANSAISRHED
jgi:hypothetical protein